MYIQFWWLLGAVVLGIYMAWNIGANDVANSMASAVGSKAVTFRQAVFIAALLNIIGAVFVGSHVTQTVSKGIISSSMIGDPHLIEIGFLAVLLAAGIWVTFSTWLSMPISTTHSIVGALIGFGLVVGGRDVVHWRKLWEVVSSWIISPIFAGLIAFFLFHFIARFILQRKNNVLAARRFSPLFVGGTIFIINLSLFLKTRLGAYIGNAVIPLSLFVAVVSGVIGYYLAGKISNRGGTVELIFKNLQIMTSCYVALSHGANDVANAAGPLVSIFYVANFGKIPLKVQVPEWVLVVIGLGIALGITTWGYRVMKTVAYKITKITNVSGFTIQFSAATSILISSKLGMPVSTTHAVIGAVIGAGFAHGIEAVDLNVVKRIIVSWFVTIPAAALTTIPIYLGLLHIWR